MAFILCYCRRNVIKIVRWACTRLCYVTTRATFGQQMASVRYSVCHVGSIFVLTVIWSCLLNSVVMTVSTVSSNISWSKADVVPPCVNGNIAIQWERSNFDPSQNPNSLTDYDKTLHNWLRPRDIHVTQNLCQLAVKERLAKYAKYKTLFFFIFILIFPPDSPTEVTYGWILTNNGSKHALWHKELPFGGLHNGWQHFGVQISQKPPKMAFYMARSSVCKQTRDEWRHRRLTSLSIWSDLYH